MSRPNILWICTDQQRWDTLGCYGNPHVHSPNIDKLAGESALFERTYSQSPVCTPSRSSFLTGRYPRTTRSRQNGADIPADERLVTRLLADAGYTCGLAGKLHLSACNPSVCEKMERRIDDGYAEFHWSHHSNDGWALANEYWAWLDERGQQFHTPTHPDSRWVRVGMPEEYHQTTWCIDRARDFITRQANADHPWLFSINMFDPHPAFDPPPERLARYTDHLHDLPLPLWQEGELDNKTPFQIADHQQSYGGPNGYTWDTMAKRDHQLLRAAYYAMCDTIDAQVGRLLATLDETGQRDNTLVIFMSDHGEMLGDHGLYLKGPYFYEQAIHVPLMIRQPGAIAPRRVSTLVELTDLAPMLLDAAGVEQHPGMQGKSLWPLLTGQADDDHHRDDVYCEYYADGLRVASDNSAYLTMVRTDRHKLVVDHTHDTGEMYDLHADPDEQRNLWHDATQQSVKVDLLTRLCHRMAGTIDPLPPRLAPW